MAEKRLKIIIVEDENLYRELLQVALSQHEGLEVVGSYAVGASALEAAPALQPAVAILDIELPGMNGVQLGLRLRSQLPHLGIVLLSNHQDPAYLAAVPESAIAGWSYLLKRSVSDLATLERAVVGAAGGWVVLDPKLVAAAGVRKGGPIDTLTPRQSEVLALIAQGYSNVAIAEALVLAPKSVENHINQLYQQLGIDSSDAYVQPRVTAVLKYLAGH